KRAGKSLGAKVSGVGREDDAGGSMVDRYRPRRAGDVPIDFIVIGEEARAVAQQIGDLDGAGGVVGARNVNLQVEIVVLRVVVIAQISSVGMFQRVDLQKQF